MKDLIEQIRTVHFTILVVALVLTAALQIERKRPLERAAADAEAVRQLSEKWAESTTAIAADVDKVLADRKEQLLAQYAGLMLGSDSDIFVAEAQHLRPLRDPRVLFQTQSSWIYFDADKNEPGNDGSVPKWTTLRQFVDFWDHLHEGTTAFLPLAFLPGDATKFCSNLARVDPRTVGGVRPAMILFSAHRTAADHWTFQSGLDAGEPHCKFQPVNLDALTIDLGHAFQTVVPQAASWGAGRSTDEFSELLAASKYFEDSPSAMQAKRSVFNTAWLNRLPGRGAGCSATSKSMNLKNWRLGRNAIT